MERHGLRTLARPDGPPGTSQPWRIKVESHRDLPYPPTTLEASVRAPGGDQAGDPPMAPPVRAMQIGAST